jgi:hypothetical protein
MTHIETLRSACNLSIAHINNLENQINNMGIEEADTIAILTEEWMDSENELKVMIQDLSRFISRV